MSLLAWENRAKGPLSQLRYTLLTADFSRPEMFQTFYFGTNVYETSAVRSAEKKRENTSNAGMKLTYPLVFRSIWPLNLSVFGNAVLDDNCCFFIFFLFKPIGIPFDNHLPKVRAYRLRLRNHDWGWVNAPSFTHFHKKSTATEKMDHLGRFRPSPSVRMFIRWVRSISNKKIKYSSMRGRNGLSPGFRNSFGH